MRRQHLMTLGAALVAAGCTAEPSAGGPAATPADETVPESPAADPSTPEADVFGDLLVEDVADTVCEEPPSTTVDVFPELDYPPIPAAVAPLGPTRVLHGGDVEGLAFVDLMEGEGTFMSADVHAATADDDRVWAVSSEEGGGPGGAALVARAFDDRGKPLGPKVAVAQKTAHAVAVAANGGVVLVAWAADGAIVVRQIVDGEPMPTQVVAVKAYLSTVDIALASSDAGFAMAWTADPIPGSYETHVTTTFSGNASPPVVVTSAPHALGGLSEVDDGLLLLLTGPAPESHPTVIPVDTDGYARGPARRMLGAHFGWGLASRAGETAIAASRSNGQPEIRIVDSFGVPLSPWRCLSHEGDLALPTAVTAHAGGFDAVFYEPTELPEGRTRLVTIVSEEESL